MTTAIYKLSYLKFKNVYDIPCIGVKRFLKRELTSLQKDGVDGIKIWLTNNKKRIITRRLRKYLRKKGYNLGWGKYGKTSYLVIYKEDS